MSGFFLVVEGPEGAGKSTLVAGLAARMQSAGIEPVTVREPGGTPAAEAIRAAFLDPDHPLGPNTELLYVTAARAHWSVRFPLRRAGSRHPQQPPLHHPSLSRKPKPLHAAIPRRKLAHPIWSSRSW